MRRVVARTLRLMCTNILMTGHTPLFPHSLDRLPVSPTAQVRLEIPTLLLLYICKRNSFEKSAGSAQYRRRQVSVETLFQV